MRDFWLNLNDRDRLSLVIGIVFVAALLFYSLAWEPVAAQRDYLKESVSEQQQLLQWMESAAVEVQRLQKDSRNSPGLAQGSLLSQVESTVKKMGFSDFLKRMQPEGEEKVRIWFDGIKFDDLLLWMGTVLKGGRVAIEDLAVDGTDMPGIVNVRLLLRDTIL